MASVGRINRQHLATVVCTQAGGGVRTNPDSNIERFKPDFARTLRPGWLAVPAADFDMLATLKSSMTIIAWFLLIIVLTL